MNVSFFNFQRPGSYFFVTAIPVPLFLKNLNKTVQFLAHNEFWFALWARPRECVNFYRSCRTVKATPAWDFSWLGFQFFCLILLPMFKYCNFCHKKAPIRPVRIREDTQTIPCSSHSNLLTYTVLYTETTFVEAL